MQKAHKFPESVDLMTVFIMDNVDERRRSVH